MAVPQNRSYCLCRGSGRYSNLSKVTGGSAPTEGYRFHSKPCFSHYPTPGLTAAFRSHQLPTSSYSAGPQLISHLPSPSLGPVKNSSIVQGSGEEEGALLGFIAPLGAPSLSFASWCPEKTGLVFQLWFFYLPPHPMTWAQTASTQQGHAGLTGLPCQAALKALHLS